MKKFFVAIFLGLMIGAYAHAALPASGVKVSCAAASSEGPVGIEIQETDLTGQYVLIETFYDSDGKISSNSYSPVFSMVEIENNEFPALTSRNGYTRTLIRSGAGNYRVETRGECSSATIQLNCQESF